MRGKLRRFKIFGWFVTAFKFDKPKPQKAKATDGIRAWGAAARGTFEHQFRELNRGGRK